MIDLTQPLANCSTIKLFIFKTFRSTNFCARTPAVDMFSEDMLFAPAYNSSCSRKAHFLLHSSSFSGFDITKNRFLALCYSLLNEYFEISEYQDWIKHSKILKIRRANHQQ